MRLKITAYNKLETRTHYVCDVYYIKADCTDQRDIKITCYDSKLGGCRFLIDTRSYPSMNTGIEICAADDDATQETAPKPSIIDISVTARGKDDASDLIARVETVDGKEMIILYCGGMQIARVLKYKNETCARIELLRNTILTPSV